MEIELPLARNKVLLSGVIAMADGPAPLGTLLPTCEAAPLVKFMVNEVTIWSPCVATHMKPALEEPTLFELTQPVKVATIIIASTTGTQRDFMCILFP